MNSYLLQREKQVNGIPYIDENGVLHDDLVMYRSGNRYKIYCPQDNALYIDAVVRIDSHAQFYETDELIEDEEEENGKDTESE